MTTAAELLHRVRIQLWLSLRALTQQAGASVSTISRIEAGQVAPTFGMLCHPGGVTRTLGSRHRIGGNPSGVTTPVPREPHDDFVERHRSMDERLEEAFIRYDKAFHAFQSPTLLEARLDLSLLLWADDPTPPDEVRRQLVLDAELLLRQTPPLT